MSLKFGFGVLCNYLLLIADYWWPLCQLGGFPGTSGALAHPLYSYFKASIKLNSFSPMACLFMVPGTTTSSQEHSCGLCTHRSSSNYQLRPRHVFDSPSSSHSGRGLAEDRGTLPWPRGLGLCRTRSQKDLCTVSARCESFHLHVNSHKLWTLAGMFKNPQIFCHLYYEILLLIPVSFQSLNFSIWDYIYEAKCDPVLALSCSPAAGGWCCGRSAGNRAGERRQALRVGSKQLRMAADAVCHSQSWNYIGESYSTAATAASNIFSSCILWIPRLQMITPPVLS